MQEKVYLYLFIFCSVLSQGILGKFLEDDNGEISKVLARKKRVISRIPEEDVPVDVGDVPYLVNIKKTRRLHCLGTILSHHTVITAARCVSLNLRNYEVLSGSTISNRGIPHNITRRVMRGHEPSRSSAFSTGIALITVSPPLAFRTTVFQISVHTEPVIDGMIGTISGWGSFVFGGQGESNCSHRLRSVTVPIMHQQECRNIYHGHFPITDEDFCTYHSQRLCGYSDIGAPFVIGNKLVGVHIGNIETAGREIPIKPDVFVRLQHPLFNDWINRNIVL